MISIPQQIKKHAIDAFPEECVGMLVGKEYTRLENISSKPTEGYSLTLKDKIMLSKIRGKLTALVHSHPHLNSKPSIKDLKAQQTTQFNFWIIGTDGQKVTRIRKINYENANQ